MKKIITTIVSSLLILITCHGTQVPVEQARVTATNFYLERINLHSQREQVTITGEFTIKKGEVPVYYIFNMDNEGFIIVSADDRSFPVLGYSFEGTYKPNRVNPAFNNWMANYRDQILSIRENQYKADQKITEAWLEYSSETGFRNKEEILEVEPLLTALWCQDFPYNTNCPYDTRSGDDNFTILDSLTANLHNHVPTGCVATATGMIMNYWRYPPQGAGQHCSTSTNYGLLCVDYSLAFYDWAGMVTSPGSENDAIAKLLYHCGVSENMIYNYNASLAFYEFIPETFRDHFLYDSDVVLSYRGSNYSEWINILKTDLNAGRPIQYSGQTAANPNDGHSFVCDGYQGTDFFHMNWGWEGGCNGYFYLNNLNPWTFDFNVNQAAVLHIYPSNESGYPYYCTGQTNLLANDFGSIEDGSGPVLNYQNNTDCSWLIAPDDSIASLSLKFVKFNLHTSDTLKVYDGENAYAGLIGSYTGNSLPESITASGKKLFLRFITDGSFTSKGFLAEYSSTEYTFCTETVILNGMSGVISDGSGRFNYRNGSDCVWKIVSPWIDDIHLKFTQINTELDRDEIKIYKPNSTLPIATYSGYYMNLPDTLVIEASEITIVFKADSAFRKPGWSANYQIGSVGTNDVETGFFKLYPNPANTYFAIETVGKATGTRLVIMNTAGRLLYTKSLNSPTTWLDISTFGSGVYLVRLETANEVVTRKLVIL